MSKEASKKWEKNSPQHSNEWVNQNYSNDDEPPMKKITESHGEYQFRRFWHNTYRKEPRVSNPVTKNFIRHIWLAIYQSPLRPELTKGEN